MKWNDATVTHVKQAIAARTCPLCGGRLRIVRRYFGRGVFDDREDCGACGARIGEEAEGHEDA